MKPIDTNDIPRLKSDVRYRVIDDEAIIVCQDRGEIIAVNEVGRLVLDAVDGKTSIAAMIGMLASSYDVPVKTLQEDVLEFIAEMLHSGVLEF